MRFVPNLKKKKKNLVLLGVLDDSGYVSKIEDGVFKILKSSMVVIKG